jgi:hypothetical protein
MRFYSSVVAEFRSLGEWADEFDMPRKVCRKSTFLLLF